MTFETELPPQFALAPMVGNARDGDPDIDELIDRRPRTDELLGVAEDWLDGQSVDDYIDEIRDDQ